MQLTARRLVRVTSLTPKALDFACHSKACAPPPIGSGGSNDSGGGARVHPDAKAIFAAVRGMEPGRRGVFSAKEHEKGREMQAKMYEVAGFNGKARVVGTDQFNELVGRGKDFEEGWRGVVAFDERRTEAQVGRGLIDDDTHFPGNGIYGNGTYFAHHPLAPDMAMGLASDYGPMLTHAGIPKSILNTQFEDINVAADYARQILELGINGPGQFEGDAYIPSKKPGAMELSAQKVVEAGRSAGLSDPEIMDVVRDAGRMAILMGVSGYTVPQKYGGNYVVVLNRGAIVLDRTVMDEAGHPSIPQDGYTKRGLKRGEDLSAEDLIDLACHSKACAPPPTGSGGSKPGGSAGRVFMSPKMVPKNAGAVLVAGASRESEQEMQVEMYRAAGFNGRATVVGRDEFNDLQEEGMSTGMRGVVDPGSPAFGTDLERSIARSLIDDENHFPGRGISGNGTYVAYSPDGLEYSAQQAASLYGENLLRIGLPKNIIETTFEDVHSVGSYVDEIAYGDGPNLGARPSDKAEAVFYDTAMELFKRGRAEGLDDFEIAHVLGDDGRLGIALGLDGYTIKHDAPMQGAEYVVVLNRSAVTLDRTVYDRTGINPRHTAEGYDDRGNPA